MAILHGFLSLGMVSEESEESDDEAEAAQRVARAQRALQSLHARLLLRLARTWRSMLLANSTLTIMDFPVALRQTQHHLERALIRLGPLSLQQRDGAADRWRLWAVERELETDEAEHESSPPAWGALVGLMSLVLRLCCTAPREGTESDKKE